MGTTKKTDNRFMGPKLLLRRHFLQRYHRVPPRVLDCCQGSGKLWGALMQEFPVKTYWGLDKKPKKGRIAIDSERILASGKWVADVVDVDTYGSPWGHWFHLLRTGTGPLTVFLTVGLVRVGGGGMMATVVKQAIGLSKLEPKLVHRQTGPITLKASLLGKLHDFSVAYCLRQALPLGWQVIEAQEAFPSDKARYFGVHLIRPPQMEAKGSALPSVASNTLTNEASPSHTP